MSTHRRCFNTMNPWKKPDEAGVPVMPAPTNAGPPVLIDSNHQLLAINCSWETLPRMSARLGIQRISIDLEAGRHRLGAQWRPTSPTRVHQLLPGLWWPADYYAKVVNNHLATMDHVGRIMGYVNHSELADIDDAIMWLMVDKSWLINDHMLWLCTAIVTIYRLLSCEPFSLTKSLPLFRNAC